MVNYQLLVVISAISCVIGLICCVIGVALWIAVGVVTDNPPNGSKLRSSLIPTLDFSLFISQAYEKGDHVTLVFERTNPLTCMHVSCILVW